MEAIFWMPVVTESLTDPGVEEVAEGVACEKGKFGLESRTSTSRELL
jgi:hypothetical protein